MTSFAALLALVAFGPGVTTVLGGDNGTSVGTPGVAGAPAIPPVPGSVPARTFAPAPAPVPASTLAPAPVPLATPTLVSPPATAPAPVLSPAPAGPVRDEVRNPGTIQTPGVNINVGVPGNGNVAVAANPGGDQWRYRWHRNNWWYWTTENRWVYRNGNEWVNYEPAVTAVPAVGYTSQPAYAGSHGIRSVWLYDWIPWLFWSSLPERLLLWLGWLLRAAGDLVRRGLWSWIQNRLVMPVLVGIQPPFCRPERRFPFAQVIVNMSGRHRAFGAV